MTAPAPSRASTSGTLAFGLVSIPVQVYAGHESYSIERSEFIKEGTEYIKVGRASIRKDTNAIVDPSQVVKLISIGDTLCELSDEEIERIIQPRNGLMEIEAFLPLSLLGSGRYVPIGVNQVRPTRVKTSKGKAYDPAASRSFNLLMTVMRKRGVFALVNQCVRGKYTYSALMPNGRLLPLLSDEEVREALPLPDVPVSDNEVALAEQLMDGLYSDTPVPLTNPKVAEVLEYAAKKAGGEKVEVREAEVMPEPEDLLAALQKAIDQQKQTG